MILDQLLDKRQFERDPETLPNWTDALLRRELGDDALDASLSDDDLDYLVERFIDYLDGTPRPTAWTVFLLEKTHDERALEAAIRLLKRSLTGDDANMESCAIAALNILVPFQDRPEVLDAIEEAGSRGEGGIRETALDVLEIRKQYHSDNHADTEHHDASDQIAE